MKQLFLFLFLFLAIFYSGFQLQAQVKTYDKNIVTDFFQNQQFEEAIKYLGLLEGSDSNNIQLLSFMGYAYYMSDNVLLAQKYYHSIFTIDSLNISALQYLAILNKTEHTDEAIGYTRRLMNLQPDKAAHFRNMAALFKKSTKKDSIYAYSQKAYQMAPNDYKNTVFFADVLIDNQKFTSADSILKIALLSDTNNIPVLKTSIRSAYIADDFKNVLAPGEKLLALDEPALTPLTQLFLSYYTLKLYKDCIRVCEYLKSRGFLIENVLFYQAKSYAKLKDFKKSNDLLNTCLSLAVSKQAEMYLYNMALNYEDMKQYKKAITNYDTAYYLFNNPVMNYNSGRIAELYLKNLNLAGKYYKAYLLKAQPQEADEKKAYDFTRKRWGRKTQLRQ